MRLSQKSFFCHGGRSETVPVLELQTSELAVRDEFGMTPETKLWFDDRVGEERLEMKSLRSTLQDKISICQYCKYQTVFFLISFSVHRFCSRL
jgi:hypothetical protein